MVFEESVPAQRPHWASDAASARPQTSQMVSIASRSPAHLALRWRILMRHIPAYPRSTMAARCLVVQLLRIVHLVAGTPRCGSGRGTGSCHDGADDIAPYLHVIDVVEQFEARRVDAPGNLHPHRGSHWYLCDPPWSSAAPGRSSPFLSAIARPFSESCSTRPSPVVGLAAMPESAIIVEHRVWRTAAAWSGSCSSWRGCFVVDAFPVGRARNHVG